MVRLRRKDEKIKVLFLYTPPLSSFKQRDLEILRKNFNVKVLCYDRLVKSFFKLLIGIAWADVVFSWFGYKHSFWAVLLSKILKKKTIIVIGGGEVARVPEIGYGLLLSSKNISIIRYILENTDLVLTVDESLKRDAIKNLGVYGKNIQTLPTGYDPEFWKPSGKKNNVVLTVSYIYKSTIKRKGLRTFIEASRLLPDVKFVIVGSHIDNSIEELKAIAGQNVEFTGFIPDEELLRYYQRSKVYCQLSRYEGLPNALCEAMLCECVPVGTNYCGIPTAIGDTGFYVPYGDPIATANAIKKALKSNKGKKARERIKNLFPIEKRERSLVKIIYNLCKFECRKG